MKKSVLITGASSGIGQAAAHDLADRGYEVFATYRSDRDRAALAAIENIHPVKMEVTSDEDIASAVDLITETVGDRGLFAVVNNAGTTYAAPFEFADAARAQEVMDVNVMAPYRISQAFIPLMLDHNLNHAEKARVVNVASWAGMMASPFIPFYNASKFAIVGLTESMYYDLRLLDIHAVLAVPGTTKTPLLAKTTADATASLAAMPAEGRERYRALFDHYASLSARSDSMPILVTAEKAGSKLAQIVDKTKPRFKYYLSTDARFIDRVATRLPWSARVAMTSRMYRLNDGLAVAGVPATSDAVAA